MKKPTVQRLLLSALIGLCGAAGMFFTPLMMLLPALLAFVAVAWGGSCGLVAFLLAGMGAGYVAGANVWYALAAFLPAALVIGLCLKRGLPYRTAVAGAIFCLAAGQYLQICFPSLLAGLDPFAAVREAVPEAVDFYLKAFTAAGMQLPASTAAIILDMTPQITVMAILVPAMLYGFADVLIAWALCKKSGTALKPMAKLRDWRMSRDALIGAGILAAGAIAVRLFSLKYAAAISVAVELILLGQFALNGFCYSEFMSDVVRLHSPGRKVLRYVLYVLFVPYSLFALAFMGLLEALLKLRARYTAAPKE